MSDVPLSSHHAGASPDDEPRRGNRILAALPQASYQALRPHMEILQLRRGAVLRQPGETIRYVTFSLGATFSIMGYAENGLAVEAGIVGREGFVGLSVVLADGISPHVATVQIGGPAARLPAAVALNALNEDAAFRHGILRYAQYSLSQVVQTALCHRVHSIEQRLARWLLMASDATGHRTLDVTQEIVAMMVGSHRPATTLALRDLERREFIGCSRSRIEILDWPGLEATSCRCYGIIRAEWDRLFL